MTHEMMSTMPSWYPISDYSRSRSRDQHWETWNSANVLESVDFAIDKLGLELSWDEIHKDPMKEAVAEALFESILSCFGPKMNRDVYLALNKKFLGEKFRIHAREFDTTANHEAVPGKLISLDKDKNPTLGSLQASINMPTFPTRSDGKPNLGDISPIRLYKEGNRFLLEFETPRNKHKWIKEFQVIEAPKKSSSQIVGSKAGSDVFVYDVSTPCVTNYRVLFLTDTCGLDCDQCTYLRGTGLMTQVRKNTISETFDYLIEDELEKHSDTFRLTISSGSADNLDAGYAKAHGWALKQLEEKLKKVKIKKGEKWEDMKVELELEMTLPEDKDDEWDKIINDLNYYVGLGWNISLAMNMEALSPEWRKDFIHKIKGKTTLEDYIKFAGMLKEKTKTEKKPEGIRVSTLVMFGMKPVEISYKEYMLEELNIIEQLLAAGIGVDLNPVKLQLGRNIESFPAPDPVFYMIQDLALRMMIKVANLPEGHGCVSSCGLCHHKRASLEIVNRALREHIPLPGLLYPILEKLDSGNMVGYMKKFREIYVKAQQKYDSDNNIGIVF